jgi:hypothetical protein
MNKKEVIKEIIADLLEIRQKRYDELIDVLIEQDWALAALNDGYQKANINIFDDDKKKDGKDIWDDFVADFDLPLIKLNNLLSKQDQNEEVLQIEKDMVKLHNKKNLSVKDFDEKYNMSKSSQQQYRSRLYNPLPYHQKVAGGKITYVAEEVERWFENQYK